MNAKGGRKAGRCKIEIFQIQEKIRFDPFADARTNNQWSEMDFFDLAIP